MKRLVLEELEGGFIDAPGTYAGVDYARCEWCGECAYHDLWARVPVRAFYLLPEEGLTVCEHCLHCLDEE
jgi:ferredoxin